MLRRSSQGCVDCRVQYWLSRGCPRHKLIVGIPSYGRSWTLSSAATAPLSPASGAGTVGPLSGEAGYLMYNEICANLAAGWTKVTDGSGRMGPYAYSNTQWVGYDDADSVAIKAQYIVDQKLGGGMFWDLPSDDFDNLCGDGRYPLITTVNNILKTGSTCSNGKSLNN